MISPDRLAKGLYWQRALRREIETLLGVTNEPCSDGQFEKGVEAVRKLLAENVRLKARGMEQSQSNHHPKL
jgi:hypothetical protein